MPAHTPLGNPMINCQFSSGKGGAPLCVKENYPHLSHQDTSSLEYTLSLMRCILFVCALFSIDSQPGTPLVLAT